MIGDSDPAGPTPSCPGEVLDTARRVATPAVKAASLPTGRRRFPPPPLNLLPKQKNRPRVDRARGWFNPK